MQSIKRLLSAILVALIIFTSVPFATFSVTADISEELRAVIEQANEKLNQINQLYISDVQSNETESIEELLPNSELYIDDDVVNNVETSTDGDICINAESGTVAPDIWDGTVAEGFESGTGTEADPYIIKTPEQLAYLAKSVNAGNNYKDKYIKLANDIYLNDTDGWENWGTTTPANTWTPIGTSYRFDGTFDGYNYTVSGIYTGSTKKPQGLFGCPNGKIQNLGIVESYISGKSYVGGVCGLNYGTVVNCYNAGTVSGNESAGGVCGYNGDTVLNCYNIGMVGGKSYVGGVCGENSGTVINCYNSGIDNGDVTVGGVCGKNSGTVTNCYNAGMVNGNSSVGGVCGNNVYYGIISNCYNTGAVSGDSCFVGGVCGNNGNVVSNCYYVVGCASDCNGTEQNGIGNETKGQTTADSSGSTTVLTDVQMQQQSSFVGFDFVNVWATEPSTGYLYPQFIRYLDKSLGESSAIWIGIIADGFAGGTGTELDPYIIEDAEQLAYLSDSVNDGNDYSGKYVKLANDIILNDNSKKYWILNATVWTPIGTHSNWFRGTFDGDGHTVFGIYTDISKDYQGLFGYSQGIIQNLGIEKSFICGNKYVGGVCGANDYDVIGTIANCYNTGTVSGNQYVGGVCGYNNGTINECYNTGAVSGEDSAGGVCGYNKFDNYYLNTNDSKPTGTVTNCYNIGTVSGTDNIGGICGDNYSAVKECYNTGTVIGCKYIGGVCGNNRDSYNIYNGIILYCYNIGTVLGEDFVGGVCGSNAGTLNECYNIGTVKGAAFVGGVCGHNIGTLIECYNIGAVSGKTYIGGVCGYNTSGTVTNCYNTGSAGGNQYVGGVCGSDDGTVTNCYYLSGCAKDGNNVLQYGIGNVTQGQTTADVFGSTMNLTDIQMQQQSSFKKYDFVNIWAIEPSTGYAYPQFMRNLDKSYGGSSAVWIGTVSEGFARGTGTEADPYIIETAEQLAYFATSVNSGTNYSSKYIKLANDIVLNDNSQKYWILNATSWIPIGTSYSYFDGVFDGDGHTVKGIYIDDLNSYQGLFGYSSGTIKSIGVEKSYILGNSYVGGVCGYNNGMLIESFNTCTVIGEEYVGGVCGYNNGTMNGCYNICTVNGEEYAGGICGYNNGTVNGCYNTCAVTGEEYIGGVCGYNNCTVRECYNTSTLNVTGDYAGGVCGHNNGTLSECYNTGAVNGKICVGGVCGDNRYDSNYAYTNVSNSTGTVTNCYNTGTVSGVDYIGGVCGENFRELKGCYNTGTVSGCNYTGGVCGYNYECDWEYSNRISNCYNTGIVSGDNFVGGICGDNQSTVTNCYNVGTVSGDSFIGGVCGKNTSSLLYCYNYGAISGSNSIGGVCGDKSGTVTNCYYLLGCAKDESNILQYGIGNVTQGQTTADVSGSTISLTDVQMQQQSSFDGFDFVNIWTIESSTGYAYPRLIGFIDKSIGGLSAVWTGAVASGFSGGTGTEADPYIIETAEQLAYLAYSVNSGINYQDNYIKLANDIILNDNSQKYWTLNASTWMPIGTQDSYFCGIFDGEGHTVKGIYIDDINNYQGLFGYSTGTIKNLGVEKSYIFGNAYVGGVCGYNNGILNGCHNTGTVNGKYYIGGVCGYNIFNDNYYMYSYMYTDDSNPTGTVTNCCNTGTVSGLDYIGGVCGKNCRVVKECFNSGNVSGRNYIGGVCGYTYEYDWKLDNCTIVYCYNTGMVSGENSVGGVCGENQSTVTSCYNMGAVSGFSLVGGVCGKNTCNMLNCYNDGTISGSNSIGGVCGGNQGNVSECFNTSNASGKNNVGCLCGCNDGTVTNCYYLSGCAKDGNNVLQYGIGNITEGQTTADVSGSTTGLTDAQMQQQFSFDGFDFANIWAIESSTGYAYPQLINFIDKSLGGSSAIWTGAVASGFSGGTGTEADPYIIETAEQLAYLAYSVNNGISYQYEYFKLANDIILNDNSQKYWTLNATTWMPIGTSLSVFCGIFDGDGHTVKGIYIDDINCYQGLFGYSIGTIKGVGVEKSYVFGNAYIGGVCGYSTGTIMECYNTGTVSGEYYVGGVCGYNSDTTMKCYNTGTVYGSSDYVGGICGENSGTVTNCYNGGNVRGNDFVGGVYGRTYGSMTDCYNTGNVCGNQYVGGIYGYKNSGTTTNSYNIGSVSGNQFVGGVCGKNYGKVTNCYYLIGCAEDGNNTVQNGTGNETQGQTTADIAGNTTGLTNEQMQQQTSFAEFDFDTIWTIGVITDYDYPTLLWQKDATESTLDIWDGTVAEGFESGTGTETDPYIIKTPEQLAYLANSVNSRVTYKGKFIKLANDIYLNATKNWKNWSTTAPANTWIPIGTSSNYFEGTFYGDGYAILGIYTDSTKDYQGLFGYSKGIIKDIGVKQSYICGNNYVGGVCGNNSGTVTDSYNIGSVRGANAIGGVCGSNNKTVIYCYNAGTVSGENDIGGVCGANWDTVVNVYNTGSVSGKYYVGGVCGLASFSTETNCYYLLKCTEDGNNTLQKGIGMRHPTETTTDIAGKITGLTAGQMQQQTSFDGFDFDTVWIMPSETSDYKYPILRACHTHIFISDSVAAPTCTDQGYTKHICYYGCEITDTYVDALGHDWGNITYVWDGDKCTATRACSRDNSHVETETVTAVYVKDADASCATNEKGHYEATFTNPAFEKQATAENSVEKSGTAFSHNWGTPTYTWNGDKCTATRVCSNNPNHKEIETVTGTYIKDTVATCTTNEKGHFEATFENLVFEKQTTAENSYEIPGSILRDAWDGTVASGFESGTGTVANPYIIKTAEQLAYFASSVNSGVNYSGKYIKLANDIYLNVATYNYEKWGTTAPANIWAPIGTPYSKCFYGTFDGDGYSVFGIYTDSTKNYQGLFGYSKGIIKNVGVEQSYVCGKNNVGGVCGYNYGTVQGCYNNGIVIGSNYVGGVCGDHYGTAQGCYNNGVVNGSSSVGGVCGKNNGNLMTQTYNIGRVIGDNRVGGICGENYGTVTNSYNTGSVDGTYDVGGVCGYNYVTATNNYNAGSVKGEWDVGGVCGLNYGTVKDSHNTGSVSGNLAIGGVCGGNVNTVTNCYYLLGCAEDANGLIQRGIGNSTQGQTTADITGITTALTDEQMQQKASFVGFDFVNVWTIEAASGYAYPQFMRYLDKSLGGLSSVWTGTVAKGFAGGTGTQSDPYIIKTAEQLAYLASSVNNGVNYSGKYIKLFNDIVLNDNSQKNWILNATVWTPIGTSSSKSFRGTFDGDGHTISGVYIDSIEGYQGLFGYSAGTIKNVGVEDSFICAFAVVGGVCAYNGFGTVMNCYNTGSISGVRYIGGVCGCNESGTLKNSYNTGNVSGYNYVGGVCGNNSDSGYYYSTLTNCYNTGNVSGSLYIGGVCGFNNGGYATVSYSYNTGIISGSGNYVGGVCGYNTKTVQKCYYLSGCATDGSNVVQNGIGNQTKGQTTTDVEFVTTGLTAEQMKQQTSFTGFDFDTAWIMPVEVSEYKYPILRACHVHIFTSESVVIDPTCTERGYTKHTCYYGCEVTDTYVDALGHDLINITYEWNGDQCTATGKCTRDNSHVETETVTRTYVKDTDATCTTNEKGHYEATFTNFSFAKQTTAANSVDNGGAGHSWGTPTYSWNGDKCTATRVCTRDKSHVETETVTGTYVKDTDATCTTNEKGHYEATFTNSSFAKQTSTKSGVEKSGTAQSHSYGTPTNTWNGDKCTATRVCANDSNHKETETVTGVYVKDTDATCTTNEKGHYEATFVNPAFEKQTTAANSVEKSGTALNHNWGTPTYVWNEDKCTATRVCLRDQSHIETETVTAVFVKDTDATCTTNEKGHYETTFVNAAFAKQTTASNSTEKSGTAQSHKFNTPTYSWSGDKCTITRVCANDPNHIETETATAVYVKDSDATCTTNEKGHYEATFVNPAFEKQVTAANSVEKTQTYLNHSYSLSYESNGDGHWHKCSRCGATTVLEVHVYSDGSDATCNVCNYTRNLTVYGDVNGDGNINGQDVVRLKKYLANYDYNTNTSTVEICPGADANGDGNVNGQDVVRLKKYLANYDYDTNTSTIKLGP